MIFFSSANSGKGRNKAMLQALTGLQFPLRGKLQDQKWPDKHPREEAHAHYSQSHMPVSQYPAFNGFFPMGTHFSSDKAPAISEVPILPADIYKQISECCVICQKLVLIVTHLAYFGVHLNEVRREVRMKLLELTCSKKYIGLQQANTMVLN